MKKVWFLSKTVTEDNVLLLAQPMENTEARHMDEVSSFSKAVYLLVLRHKLLTFMATFAHLQQNWIPSQEHAPQV